MSGNTVVSDHVQSCSFSRKSGVVSSKSDPLSWPKVRRMGRLLVIGGVAVLSLFTWSCGVLGPDQDYWGAVAAGPGNGYAEIGVAYNKDTEAEAELAALSRCDGDCNIQATFKNVCIAVALSPNGWFSYRSADRRETAEEEALKGCNDAGTGTCRVFAAGCSKGD